ncbi:hypothetical protein DITRI_Ditri03aG0200200 [Diplodiscus trichospermus]
MDLFHPLPAILIETTIFSSPIFLFSLLWISKSAFGNRNNKRLAPEAGGLWPVIGHLHLLGGGTQPHIVLSDMAKKYGPVFTIKMGVYRALVVNDHATARECLTTNDNAFASRPTTLAMEFLSYNHGMFGFAPYGPYWRQMRKLVTLELLSNYRLERLTHVRQSKIKTSVQELYQLWNQKKDSSDKILVEMKKWFKKVTLNVILRMIVGKRIPSSGNDTESERLTQALKDFFDLSSKFVISDALPFLRWLDIGGDKRFMKKVRKELDEIAQEWLEDHKQKRSISTDKLKSDEDFMDVMLSLPIDAEKYDADTINKATRLNMITGGSDTAKVALVWTLSFLLNNSHWLRKVQEELDIHVGKQRLVNESDLSKLECLQAVVKRLVNESDLSKLDWIFINLWKIQTDPRLWSDPLEFKPERFLTTHRDFDVGGDQYFQLIPIGFGRRVCPGMSLGLQMVQLTLASLLQAFDISTPSNARVDMSEDAGLTC